MGFVEVAVVVVEHLELGPLRVQEAAALFVKVAAELLSSVLAAVEVAGEAERVVARIQVK